MTDPSKCRMNWNSRTTYGKTGISQNCNSEISNGYIQDVHMEYQSGDIIQNIIPHECNERIICQTKEMIPRNVVTTCSEKRKMKNKHIYFSFKNKNVFMRRYKNVRKRRFRDVICNVLD